MRHERYQVKVIKPSKAGRQWTVVKKTTDADGAVVEYLARAADHKEAYAKAIERQAAALPDGDRKTKLTESVSRIREKAS